MTTDLDTLLTALYVLIDDHVIPSGQRRPGRPKRLSDPELVCLAVAQVLLCARSEHHWLRMFLGPRAPVAIPLTSPNDPGVTRTYTDWQTVTDEVINARVWEGVHFRFSDVTGVRQGLRLARWEAGRLNRVLGSR